MLEEIVEPLLLWFEKNARILPWREEKTAYRVWVSEIMLQQTRVEAVKPFFERFTKALPDVYALAQCEEERLLKLWEGLGYYNRVRNMQKAAQTVVEQYHGEFPQDYEALLDLKGIGSYTAGAVSSIAFNLPYPAVDGNVLRVISRVLASEEDIMKQSVRRKIEEQIKAIMPSQRAGDLNQALMELGATVCVPNGMAKCESCPLYSLCAARERGIVMELPKKTAKKPRKVESRTVLVIRSGEKAAIRKRKATGLLAGLYELPNLMGHLPPEEILNYLKEKNFSPIRIQSIKESKHIFSHVEWRMKGYFIQIEELEPSEEEKSIKETGMLFVEPATTQQEYPIPAAFSAYADYLCIKLGQEKYENTGDD